MSAKLKNKVSGCKYCNSSENVLLQDDFYVESDYWEDSPKYNKINLLVTIDRGHLRLVDKYETNCLDGGEKIKVNYCPICGEKIKD